MLAGRAGEFDELDESLRHGNTSDRRRCSDAFAVELPRDAEFVGGDHRCGLEADEQGSRDETVVCIGSLEVGPPRGKGCGLFIGATSHARDVSRALFENRARPRQDIALQQTVLAETMWVCTRTNFHRPWVIARTLGSMLHDIRDGQCRYRAAELAGGREGRGELSPPARGGRLVAQPTSTAPIRCRMRGYAAVTRRVACAIDLDQFTVWSGSSDAGIGARRVRRGDAPNTVRASGELVATGIQTTRPPCLSLQRPIR